MTLDFRRRAGIRSALPASTAGSSASRITAKSPFACRSPTTRHSADRLQALLARGLGVGSPSPQQGRRAGRRHVPHQARDRTRTDPGGPVRRPPAWDGVDGRRLRRRHEAAYRHHRTRPDLRCRRPAPHLGVATRGGAAAVKTLVGPRAASSSNGPRTRSRRRSTGSARYLKASASPISSTLRNSGGASSVTVRT